MCMCVCVCVSLNLARLFLLVVSLVATNVSFHAFSHHFLNLPLSISFSFSASMLFGLSISSGWVSGGQLFNGKFD